MLQVRKSKTTTNSVSNAVDSGIQYLESGFLDSVFLCLYSGYQSPGFDSTGENFPDSGFHSQKFPGSQGIHGATFCKYKICSLLHHSKGRSKRNTWTTYLRCPLTSVVVVFLSILICLILEPLARVYRSLHYFQWGSSVPGRVQR